VTSLPDLAWGAFAALQLAGSLAVTLHVLLRRPAPASAAAWIGLAWLAPGLGPLLYLVLGVNRIERRARRLRRPAGPAVLGEGVSAPPELAGLARAGLRLSGLPLLPGNAVVPLVNGEAAYPAMLAAIEGARVSVALSSYIFRHDRSGAGFVAALAAARARGVAVRVLIDGIGGGYLTAPAWRALRRAGVPAARFLHTHLPWRMPVLNLRSHRKLLIVDGAIGFAGGLNIGDEYLETQHAGTGTAIGAGTGAGHRRRAIRDTHFRFAGPVVAEMMHAFVQDWAFTTGEVLRGAAWFPPLVADGRVQARAISAGPDHEAGRLHRLRMAAASAAAVRIRIVTPYFLPDDPLAATLALAALRGVLVEILVAEHTDHVLLDWAMRDGLLALHMAGCRIRLAEPPFNHAKLMTVDGAWALVGSANWDMRSLRLNFELDVEMHDRAATAAIDGLIDATPSRPANARDLLVRGVAARLRNAAARLFLPYL
jgi:cardiolipin synthase